jgi:hypothetical protein
LETHAAISLPEPRKDGLSKCKDSESPIESQYIERDDPGPRQAVLPVVAAPASVKPIIAGEFVHHRTSCSARTPA